MADVIDVFELDEMPFDKYVDGVGYIHATGREIFWSDGTTTYEYEGDWTEEIPTHKVPDCSGVEEFDKAFLESEEWAEILDDLDLD